MPALRFIQENNLGEMERLRQAEVLSRWTRIGRRIFTRSTREVDKAGRRIFHPGVLHPMNWRSS
jgi:hypothetical protein